MSSLHQLYREIEASVLTCILQISSTDLDLPAWSSEVSKFQLIDEALPPPGMPYPMSRQSFPPELSINPLINLVLTESLQFLMVRLSRDIKQPKPKSWYTVGNGQEGNGIFRG